MKIYLDLCVYNRPFDYQGNPKILLETIGFLLILSMLQTEELQIINSFVLEYENSKNPKTENRLIIADMLNEAKSYIHYEPVIEERASAFEEKGIQHFDALHLACAEYGKADFFVSCDEYLIRKANKIENLKQKAILLMPFLVKEVMKNAIY